MPTTAEAGEAQASAVTDFEAIRAGFYAMLSRALAGPPDQALLTMLQSLEGDETPLGRSLTALAAAAGGAPGRLEDEYTRLFYGMGQGGEVLPYASYYLTGNLHDRPLAALRTDMERLGIAHGGYNREPEDHIAFLLEMMHGLIAGEFAGGEASLAEQTAFFDAHLADWAGDFFHDLEAAESAVFYRALARAGQAFLAIEVDAFRMAA